ncbi:ATP-binding protein [Streptomyces morookaense]|uniref:ATP-binding protein n=1 Tax=Streptomyces morookaense TaxID=1970 RepID=A0A7Y7B8P5_STRMO|nr:ATP-binding protein [Streptomyces morookaense]NVK80874.1 ATP-binding protein [Streptomyces morookaense]GHF13383.1 ATPase AAA [Streptomyces morookaense]
MDPTNRASEEFRDDAVHDGERAPGTGSGPRRPPRSELVGAQESGAPGPVRVVQLVAGDYLLTVNPLDGSEIEPCPPGRLPASRPGRHGPEEREALRRAAAPTPPARSVGPELPLLHRGEERERLSRLLSRGRSVRLTGPSGSGRTALLDAVAEDCAGLAPDGVVRLSGYHRTATDLLHELHAAVYDAPQYRPDRSALLSAVAEIGAVVVLDDLEFGGTALDELLDATPECAFLLAATPDVAAPSADSHVEEVFLGGLDRTGCLELLELAVDRPLTDEEAGWAADLWFESEGLPLRFVQAGALLRHRDEQAVTASRDGAEEAGAADEFGVSAERPYVASGESDADGVRRPALPSLAQAAAPAVLLASRLGEAARDTLRFAVALGGELPHQAHLPALAGDTHADTAVGELLACGLVTAVGAHYRLAVGVAAQLSAEGYGDEAAARAHTAAQHYAWWAGHPSVTPERIAQEADAVLAALAALVADGEAGHPAAAVLLARTAAPAFAAAQHWGAWERSLRHGQEAARLAGEVGEEAYFHHELGVLALCTGNLDRARAALEASIGLRGVLADKRGAVAGRRALALVADRTGLAMGARGVPGVAPRTDFAKAAPLPAAFEPATQAGEEVPDARSEESAAPPAVAKGPVSAPLSVAAANPDDVATAVIGRVPAPRPAAKQPWTRRLVAAGTHRNMAAAGAGALLAAVLGTVVTLGATSGGNGQHSHTVKPGQSASQQDGGDGLNADQPAAVQNGVPGVPGRSGAGAPERSGAPGVPGGAPSRSAGPSSSPGAGQSGTSPSSPGVPTDPTPSKSPSHAPSQSPTGDSPKPTPSTSSPTTKPSEDPTQSATTGGGTGAGGTGGGSTPVKPGASAS